MDLPLKARYVFSVERIWFDDAIFVTANSNELCIYEYPNSRIHTLRVASSLESIVVKDHVKLVFADHTSRTLTDLAIQPPSKASGRFRLLNDHVYFNDTKMFYLEGTYNIKIVERDLKLYRYFLNEDFYTVEEYDLFFAYGSFIFNGEFFKRNGIRYSGNYLFSSNGRDFVICSCKSIILNMAKSTEVDEDIQSVDVTGDSVVVTTQRPGLSSTSIFDMNLQLVHRDINICTFKNKHHGVLFKDNERLCQVSGSSIKLFEMYDTLKRCSLFSRNNHRNVKTTFSREGEDVVFYTQDSFSLRKISPALEINFVQNGEYIGDILGNEIYRDNLKISDVEHFDCYSNRFIVVNGLFIIVGVNGHFCRVRNTFKNVIGCDAKRFSVSVMMGGKEIFLHEVIFSLLTVQRIDLDGLFEYEVPLERFIYELVVRDMCGQLEQLLANLDYKIDLIVSRLYRKGDERIRLRLLSVLPDDYFSARISSESMAIIFLCHDINLESFIEKCVLSDNEKRVIEVFDYYSKNNLRESQEIMRVLWSMGCVKVLKQLENIDLSPFNYINEMNKKM